VLQHALLAQYKAVAENHNVHMLFPTSYYRAGKPNEMCPIESGLETHLLILKAAPPELLLCSNMKKDEHHYCTV
jgi:hypothetical protein